jgi:hypothetical protein
MVRIEVFSAQGMRLIVRQGRSTPTRGSCIGRWWLRCVFCDIIEIFLKRLRKELGILTALTQPNPEALRLAIRETRKLTSRPFGVNITLLPSINPPDYAGFARVAVEEGVRIFETAGNNRECMRSQ